MSTTTALARVSLPRLQALLQRVNSFGANTLTGGFNRVGFTKVDVECRRDFEATMKKDGLETWMDHVGNVFGRFGPADKPCVMVGSHLDTVPEGGAFDGSLGACVGLECVRALKDVGFTPKDVSLVVVATSEEEGRFGGMLGSQAMSGQASRQFIETATDANGVKLIDAMLQCGFDDTPTYEKVKACQWSVEDIVAFMEMHIEQGPLLEARGKSVGVVTGVSGVSNVSFAFEGVANHSGTTPMHLRRDAFAGLSQFTSGIPMLLEEMGTPESRITVGKVDLKPNFPHTIPGFAECSIITRDTDEEVMGCLLDGLKQKAHRAALDHGLHLRTTERSWLSPTQLDTALLDMMESVAREHGFDYEVMSSGAGHDAQTMGEVWPSALVFVQSIDGVSHSPKENTNWEDIEQGAQLMVSAIQRLLTSKSYRK
eukprot:m.105743 g.105743  ORF g.105743 m.105743 type:complete len:427 (-) comp12660_c1_seq1:132-1412(-)